MDAHTLNAWTRFALQKGGIGSCTALIDNPATDLEDLMFMTGEQITVLRRLEEDSGDMNAGSASSSSKRKSTAASDAESWFLGYCEGVVGRFKGAHVQFHGKLKKPVLMRRSGVGPLRDSTTQPMSKSEAASMHVSQVPLGIPISAIDSDGDEENLVDAYLDGPSPLLPQGQEEESPAVHADVKPPLRSLTVDRGVGKGDKGLGITTPPLSDDSHARRHARQISDSDSDESDTQLPWARSSMSSTKSSPRAMTDYTAETSQNHSTATNQRLAQLNQKTDPQQLPPSPISSAESPIYARSTNGIPPPPDFARIKEGRSVNGRGQPAVRARAPGVGHTSNQSSIATSNTSTTEESDDESQQRLDQTFSIYDVYGRDSVAFPNFDFRNLNNRSPRMVPSKSNDSMSGKGSKTSPMLQSMAMRGYPSPTATGGEARAREDSGSRGIPAALRSPSGRRPTAAPAPPSIASTLRRKVEANMSTASPSVSPITTPHLRQGSHSSANSTIRSTPVQQQQQQQQQQQHFGAFDPTRRPSMTSRFTPRNVASPDLSSMPRSPVLASSPTASSAPLPPQQQQPHVTPLGANLLARRLQEASMTNRPNAPPGPLKVDIASVPTIDGPRISPSSASLRSPTKQQDGDTPHMPSVRAPVRSSSDRSSSSIVGAPGRVGSGQLKKNPSNPQPGPYGGLAGLVAPNPPFANNGIGHSNGGLSTPTGSSRSPSPLSVPSPSSPGMNLAPGPRSASPSGGSMMSSSGNRSQMGASPSPVGSVTPRFMEPRVLSNAGSFSAYQGANPAMLQFDPLGFVTGPNIFSMPMPAEEPDEVEKWRQVLAENDLASAKKSRKVKKMTHAGVPHSMRLKVWPFLAASHVRRRPGLFEELCKTSQSLKGRKGKESLYETIDKDLDRAFPDHRLFIGENCTGRADLEAILKAYVHYNPIIGYTQGMSLVAGFLLIQMPAEEAFWMLCALLRDVHMEGYYANNMKQLHVDGIVFGQLLQTMDGELANRLMELKLEPINFAPSWLLPLFTRVVPWQTLLRLWDIFLYEGPSFLLRTALAVIRIIRDPLMDRRVCPDGGEALRLLLHPPQHLLTPENVIPCALSVKLKDGEMRKLSRQASKLVRSTNISTTRAPASAAGPGQGPGAAAAPAPTARRS